MHPHPRQDTLQPPHDHKDHHHWHWSPRSQLDAGLTLGWVALVVGGVGGCATSSYAERHSTRRDTPVTHAFCLSGHAHTAAVGNTQTRDRTQRRREKQAILGCDQYAHPVKCKRQDEDRIRGSRSIFTVFQPALVDWSDLLLPPTSSFKQSRSYHWWLGGNR